MTVNKIDELVELTTKQAEMTVAIIDLFIDYNEQLKKIMKELDNENSSR